MDQQGVGSLDRGNTGIREIDIIRTYLTYFGVKPEQVPQMIQAVVKDGAKFTRVGNTMMSMKPISQNAAQVYFFSVDRPEAFAQSMVRLIAPLKESGVQVLYMNKVDPTIVKTMQDVGIQTQQSDRPEYKVMAAI